MIRKARVERNSQHPGHGLNVSTGTLTSTTSTSTTSTSTTSTSTTLPRLSVQDVEVVPMAEGLVERLASKFRRFIEWYQEHWWKIFAVEITVLTILWVLVLTKN